MSQQISSTISHKVQKLYVPI